MNGLNQRKVFQEASSCLAAGCLFVCLCSFVEVLFWVSVRDESPSFPWLITFGRALGNCKGWEKPRKGEKWGQKSCSKCSLLLEEAGKPPGDAGQGPSWETPPQAPQRCREATQRG